MAPFGKKHEATEKKLEFAAGNSDHLTMLNAYRVMSASYYVSLIMRKPVFGVYDQGRHSNWPAQLQKVASVLKFWI